MNKLFSGLSSLRPRKPRPLHYLAGFGVCMLAAGAVHAQDEVAEVIEYSGSEIAQFTVNNLWILIAAILVFIMHLGFATLESGLTRSKNVTNILFKNTGIIAIGILTYALIGFNLMYPGNPNDGGLDGWILALSNGADAPTYYGIIPAFNFGISASAADVTPAYGDYTYWSDFIFQAMFAATAATIVSGAVAERIKIGPFLIFSAIYVAIVYPIYGSWKWGYGFLDANGFYDFAGSTIVHSVGGWGALAGVIVLGPRLGKYLKTSTGENEIHPITGHSMPLATIGVFLLWFGWFGFNGGSVLSADAAGVSFVFVTTALAAAAGIVGAMATSWIVQAKPDLTMALNGCLAGLVGITAGADCISVNEAIAVGLIAGVLVVFSVIVLDRLKLDDPVGAISVHLVCGIWGTLAVGIFGDQGYLEGSGTFGAQLLGVVAAAALCFPAALLLFLALKFTTGLRVSKEEEIMGLDIGEHGMEAYPGFQIYANR